MDYILLLPLIPISVIAVFIFSPRAVFLLCYNTSKNFQSRFDLGAERYEQILQKLRKQMGDALYADVNLCIHDVVDGTTADEATKLWKEKGLYRHPVIDNLSPQLDYYLSGKHNWDPLYRFVRLRINEVTKEMQRKAEEKKLTISYVSPNLDVRFSNSITGHFRVEKLENIEAEKLKTIRDIKVYTDDGTSCRG